MKFLKDMTIVDLLVVALTCNKSREYHFVDTWKDRNVEISGTYYDVMHKLEEYCKSVEDDCSPSPVDENDIEGWAILQMQFEIESAMDGCKYSKKLLRDAMEIVSKSL